MLLNSFHNFNSLSLPKRIVALPFPFPTKFSKPEQICLEGYIIIFNCHSSIHLFYISNRHFPLYFDSFSSTEIFIMFPAWSSVFCRSFHKFRTHQVDKRFWVILTILHWTKHIYQFKEHCQRHNREMGLSAEKKVSISSNVEKHFIKVFPVRFPQLKKR